MTRGRELHTFKPSHLGFPLRRGAMPSSSSDVEMDPEPHNLAYDPDQDPEEKRDVRKKYRAIQKTAEGAQIKL